MAEKHDTIYVTESVLREAILQVLHSNALVPEAPSTEGGLGPDEILTDEEVDVIVGKIKVRAAGDSAHASPWVAADEVRNAIAQLTLTAPDDLMSPLSEDETDGYICGLRELGQHRGKAFDTPVPAHFGPFFARVDDALGAVSDPFEKLEIVLHAALVVLNTVGNGPGHAFTADIVVPGELLGVLQVVARAGSGVEVMPPFIPADRGITRRAIQADDLLTVVPDTAVDADFREVLNAPDPMTEWYTPECDIGYRAHLKRMQSVVMAQIRDGGRLLGILRLACDAPRIFPAKALEMIRELAARLPAVVIGLPVSVGVFPAGGEFGMTVWEREARHQWRRALRRKRRAGQISDRGTRVEPVTPAVQPERPRTGKVTGLASGDGLNRRVSTNPLTRLKKLAQELAAVAATQVGAYRAAVRLLTPDRETLAVVGHVGPWDDQFLRELTPLKEHGAATTAVRTGKSQFIHDTTKDHRLKPIGPRFAASVAAVVLKHAGRVIGVLSVDWESPGAITPARQRRIKVLRQTYVVGLQALMTDAVFAELDKAFTNLPPQLAGQSGFPRDPGFRGILALIARMVGVDDADLFLRRPLTNRYHLEASLHHPEWSGEDHWYAIGEGATGWVIKHNRPLRVANLADEAELAAAYPPDPPRWVDKYSQLKNRPPGAHKHNRTYLGVPISYGSEVLGVIRLSQSRTGFGSYEERVVQEAAKRLARWLHDREAARRQAELFSLLETGFDAADAGEVADKVIHTLTAGLGEVAVSIRLVDVDRTPAGDETVLVQTAVTDPVLRRLPRVRRIGQGMSGRAASRGQPIWLRSTTGLAGRRGAGVAVLSCFGSCGFIPMTAGGALIGVLSVFRKAPGALSPAVRPADVAFVQAVARLAGPAFHATERAERAAIDRGIRAAVTEYAMSVLWNEDPVREEGRLIDRVGRFLSDRIRAALFATWEYDPTTRSYRPLTSSAGRAPASLTEATVNQVVFDQCVVFTGRDSTPQLGALLAAACAPDGSSADQRFVAVRLGANGQPFGLLLLGLRTDSPVRTTLLREVARGVHELVAVTIALVHQFETREASTGMGRDAWQLLQRIIGERLV